MAPDLSMNFKGIVIIKGMQGGKQGMILIEIYS
jgi:hypothetical protein